MTLITAGSWRIDSIESDQTDTYIEKISVRYRTYTGQELTAEYSNGGRKAIVNLQVLTDQEEDGERIPRSDYDAELLDGKVVKGENFGQDSWKYFAPPLRELSQRFPREFSSTIEHLIGRRALPKQE